MKLPIFHTHSSALFSSSYFSPSAVFSVCFLPSLFQQRWMCCVTALVLCENAAPETSKRLVLSLGSEQQSGIDLLLCCCLFVSSLTRGIWLVGFIVDCFSLFPPPSLFTFTSYLSCSSFIDRSVFFSTSSLLTRRYFSMCHLYVCGFV